MTDYEKRILDLFLSPTIGAEMREGYKNFIGEHPPGSQLSLTVDGKTYEITVSERDPKFERAAGITP